MFVAFFGPVSLPGDDFGDWCSDHLFVASGLPELDIGQQEGANVLTEPVRVQTAAFDGQRQLRLVADGLRHAPVEVFHGGVHQGGR